MEKNLFRQKTIDKMSTPDELTDYLKVTTPSVWMVLSAVLVLLIGVIIWGFLGRLDTKMSAEADVKDGVAQVWLAPADAEKVKAGMELVIGSEELTVKDVSKDEEGDYYAYADTTLRDGTYDAEITVEHIRPIKFLLD